MVLDSLKELTLRPSQFPPVAASSSLRRKIDVMQLLFPLPSRPLSRSAAASVRAKAAKVGEHGASCLRLRLPGSLPLSRRQELVGDQDPSSGRALETSALASQVSF